MGPSAAAGRGAPGSLALAALLSAAVVVTVFFPALGGEFVELSDPFLLGSHDRWHGLDRDRLQWLLETRRGGTPRPLTWLSYGLDGALGGGIASTVHATSLLLHAVTAALVTVLLVQVIARTGSPERPRSSRWVLAVATLTALAWALHPVRVEAVAWASGRGETLATALLAASALLWVRAFGGGRVRKLSAVTSWGFLCLALTAEPTFALGGGVALIALLAWLRTRAEDSAASVLGRSGLGVVVIVLAIPSLVAFASVSGAPTGPGGLESALEVCSGAMRGIRSLVWPVGLHPSYGPGSHAGGGGGTGIPPELWVDGVMLALIAVATAVGLRRRHGTGYVGLAFLALVLPAVALSREPVGADRFVQAATIPLFVAAGVVLATTTGARLRLATVATLVVVTAWGSAARVQWGVWNNSSTLLVHVLEHDPTNEAALAARGELARRSGAPPQTAASHHRRSLRLDETRPLAHAHLGRALLDQGDPRAEEHLRRAVALAPWLPAPRHDLGILLLRRDELDEAARHLTAASRLDTESAATWFALGRALDLGGRESEASTALRQAVRLAPDDPAIRAALEKVSPPPPE